MNDVIVKKRPRGILLLPNLLTTANLFCGFFSITRSFSGDFATACWLIALAGVFDFLDGRVARLANAQSDFGVQYDSLADLTTFCMAPAILTYTFVLYKFDQFGVGACFLYFACGALRMARFNTQAGSLEKVNFQGLPSPTAGGMVVSSLLFCLKYYMRPDSAKDPFAIAFLVLVVVMGLLMVSHVEYRSFKKVKRGNFMVLVIAVALVFLITAAPVEVLFAIGVTYITSGIVSYLLKSPQKIRGLKDLLVQLYNARRENLLDDDEDDENSVKTSGQS